LMKQAKGNLNASGFLGFAGGFLIGLPIGTGLAGGDPLWILAAPGAVFLFLAIPLSISSKKHIVEAVGIYNSDLTSFRPKEGFQLNFGLQDHGLGLSLKF
ncbi:MAG: hypothetical protein QNK35_15035, partial [Bacteroides sp.]|nr:hypothetical protein [Bacteroides sp.]